MSWARVAVRRPVAVSMGMVTLVLFGLISLAGLNVNLLPDLSYPTLTVRTELEGAAPAEIETLVTRPVEETVGTVNGIRRIESVSRSGQSDVVLRFGWGTSMDDASLEVREKLEILQLPFEASRPVLLRFDPSTDPILRLALGTEDDAQGDAALKPLRRHADEQLRKDLEPIEGVAAVRVSGGLEDEIAIAVDGQRLDRLGLRVSDVAEVLARENVNLSAGRLEDGTRRYLVRTINQFTSVEAIGDVIVARRGERPVYLRDVAEVTQSAREREAVTRLDGREAVEIAIYKEGDANTVAVAGAVLARLSSVRADLPAGMRLEVVENQARFIESAVDEVVGNAVLGGLLAMVVILLFLRDAASTLIIAVSIPVSIVATFFLMARTGISLNIMSLGGIALATGLLVDNAIVVLENIARRRAVGDERESAAVTGTRQVTAAIVASTLTTIAVFLPLAFVEGIAGQLFGEQALTISYALAISLIVALTLIPMLAARLGGRAEKRLQRGSAGGAWMTALRKRYRGVLEGALRHRWTVVGIAAALLAVAVADLWQRDTELVPQLSQGRFEVEAELPPGTPLAGTDRVMQRIQDAARQLPEVDYSFGIAGSGNRIDASPTESGENVSRVLLSLKTAAPDAERRAMADLRAELSGLPGVSLRMKRPELMSFDTPLEIELAGHDLAALKTGADRVAERLRTSERFVDVESSLEQGHPEVQVRFDQERISALGLTVREVADQLVNAVRGTVASRYSWRDRKIDILVRAAEEDRSSVGDLRGLIVNPGSDRPVTLAAVADVVVTEGPARIRRAGQERVAVVSANLSHGALGAAVEEAERLLADVVLPAGTVLRITGQNEELQASTRSLLFALALAVFLVYLVMASQFESLLHPFVILFSVPLAGVGAWLGLALTGTALSVMVFIGLIMLTGIVVNNAIVLIDLVNTLRADGMARYEAIVEGACQRLRPILMTTLTTTLGLLPMALGLGEGGEIRAPMAITVIGGLLVSTALTLIVIPVVYSLLDRRADVAQAESGSTAATTA